MAVTPTDPGKSRGRALPAPRSPRKALRVGTLVGVIIVGITIVLVFLFRPGRTQGPGGSAASMAKCLACKETFEVDPTKPATDPTPGRRGSPVLRFDCVHCGTDRCAHAHVDSVPDAVGVRINRATLEIYIGTDGRCRTKILVVTNAIAILVAMLACKR